MINIKVLRFNVLVTILLFRQPLITKHIRKNYDINLLPRCCGISKKIGFWKCENGGGLLFLEAQ